MQDAWIVTSNCSHDHVHSFWFIARTGKDARLLIDKYRSDKGYSQVVWEPRNDPKSGDIPSWIAYGDEGENYEIRLRQICSERII